MAGDSELAEAFKVLAWSQQNLVWARQRQANQLRSTLREYYPAALEGLANGGWNGDPRLAELGLCASAVKYDWLTPAMHSSASAPRQMRYGGTEEINADFRFRQRGIALLDNAERAQRAVTLAQGLAM